MSEMQKNWGVTDFVFEIKRVENYPNSTSKMDFFKYRAATTIAEIDDARAEKLKEIKLPQHRFSLIFHKTWIIDKESDLSKENMGSPNI